MVRVPAGVPDPESSAVVASAPDHVSTMSSALLAPIAVGLKRTLNVQCPAASRKPEQSSGRNDRTKSEASGPASQLERLTPWVVSLVTTNVIAPLSLPTGRLPKDTMVGLMLTSRAGMPVPDSAAVTTAEPACTTNDATLAPTASGTN